MPDAPKILLKVSPRIILILRGVLIACFAILAIVVVIGPGDINIVRDGDSTLYKSSVAFWSIFYFISAGMTSILAWFYWKVAGVFRLIAVGLGLASIYCLVLGLSGTNHTLRVSPHEFTIHMGTRWTPDVQTVKFDEFSEVDILQTSADKRDRGNLIWSSKSSSGQKSIPVSVLIREAMPEILDRASDAGVVVSEELRSYEPR